MRIIILLLLSLSWSAMAATTTNFYTVKESGGDYTTLSAWESGRQAAHASGDIVSDDVCEFAKIQGNWTGDDTTTVSISGWTTDATRFICVTNDTSKHDGKRFGSLSTAYRLVVVDANGFTISEEYVDVFGIQVKVTGATADRSPVTVSGVAAGGSRQRMGHLIVTGTSAANGAGIFGININDADANAFIWNCLSHGCSAMDATDGIGFMSNNGTNTFYNCTGVTNYQNIRFTGNGKAWAYNCISQNAIASGGQWVGSWTGGDWNNDDNNDASTPGANSVKNYNVTFVNEVEATADYHLDAASTSVINVTSDQSSGLFSDDIDRVTRTGSWDIGADEYVATGDSPILRVKFLRGIRR